MAALRSGTVLTVSFQSPVVTQWVENTTGGRDRGAAALARAWVEALVRPRRLFRSAVAPGDQAPGLAFGAAVVFVAEGTRALLVPDIYPVLAGQPLVSTVFWLTIAVVLVAPAALHLTAALQTVLLLAFVDDRAGVSETVQVIAYAAAPCALAGIPSPTVRTAAAGYGAVLLIVGLAEVHEISLPKAAVLGALPATLVFGYGFRGFGSAARLVAEMETALAAL